MLLPSRLQAVRWIPHKPRIILQKAATLCAAHAGQLGLWRRLPPPCRGLQRVSRLQPDLDPKMRARQLAKLEELQGAQAEHDRKERERKYAVRYHKVDRTTLLAWPPPSRLALPHQPA
jgi:hypothetical protein